MRSRLPARDRYEKNAPLKQKGVTFVALAAVRPCGPIFKCRPYQREPELIIGANFIRYANCESCVLIRPF